MINEFKTVSDLYLNRIWHITISKDNKQVIGIRRHFNHNKVCRIDEILKPEFRKGFIAKLLIQCPHLLEELLNNVVIQFDKEGFPIYD